MVQTDTENDKIVIQVDEGELAILLATLMHAKFGDCPKFEIYANEFVNQLISKISAAGRDLGNESLWLSESESLDVESGTFIHPVFEQIKKEVEEISTPNSYKEILRRAVYPYRWDSELD